MSTRPPPVPYRLLITRPAEDAAALADALQAYGVESVVEPLFDVVFNASEPLNLGGVQALAVTSANGVRALEGRSVPTQMPVYAVGDATARQAKRAGFTRVESASGAVEDLADLIGRRLDPRTGAILHVAGSAVAGDLAGRLTTAGFGYRRAVLYRTKARERLSDATRQSLTRGELDGVALYSPRTAAIFQQRVEADDLTVYCRRLTAFMLSPAVADAAAGLCWARVIVAKRADQAAMIDAIRNGVASKGTE